MKRFVKRVVPAVMVCFSGWLLARFLLHESEWERLMGLFSRPDALVFMTLLYTASFILKGWAWRLYSLEKISWSVSIQGLYASLLVNHVLPVKAGDLVRAGLAARRARCSLDEALHSVAALRSLDLLTLGALASSGAWFLGQRWPAERYVWYLSALAAVVMLAVIVIVLCSRSQAASFVGKHARMAREVLAGKRGWMILALSGASWVLEGAVLFGAARALGVELGFATAVWVTAVTIAGQVFHFTPGGLGTYESVMSATLAAGLGLSLETAFGLAVATHGFKFLYSYAAGGVLLSGTAVSWRELRNLSGMRPHRFR